MRFVRFAFNLYLCIMKTKAESIETKITKLFNKGCVEYGLLDEGDRILLALSGGKDSLELVRLMSARAKIWKPRIEVEAVHVVMDNIPYETDRTYIKNFCAELGVKLNILHAKFDESTDPRKTKCFLCAWNRRKAMFEFAAEHGFNKIALGHHNDDILTTLLMNMTMEGAFSTMTPRLELEHYPVTIIRPMCLVHEVMVKELAEELGFEKQKTLCPYEETTERTRIANIFHQLESINPETRYNMWHSMMNIRTEMLPIRKK